MPKDPLVERRYWASLHALTELASKGRWVCDCFQCECQREEMAEGCTCASCVRIRTVILRFMAADKSVAEFRAMTFAPVPVTPVKRVKRGKRKKSSRRKSR